jgi:hypothetical protein
MITLYGLGASPDPATAISGFLSTTPTPTSAQIGDFLKLFAEPARSEIAQGLIAAGVDATKVTSASQFLKASGAITKRTVYGLLTVASAAASGYHGIKRNHGSIGWGLWWFVMGGLFPIITPVIAIARSPGFAKPKPR